MTAKPFNALISKVGSAHTRDDYIQDGNPLGGHEPGPVDIAEVGTPHAVDNGWVDMFAGVRTAEAGFRHPAGAAAKRDVVVGKRKQEDRGQRKGSSQLKNGRQIQLVHRGEEVEIGGRPQVGCWRSALPH